MPVEFHEESDGAVLVVRLSEQLNREDYEAFAPEVERLIALRGKINVLVEMHDFHGWDAGALWEDLKFDLKHFNDIERLAFVGEKSWQKGMAVFCRPFTTADVEFFEPERIREAREWVGCEKTTPAGAKETP
jgi:hypothetical protein